MCFSKLTIKNVYGKKHVADRNKVNGIYTLTESLKLKKLDFCLFKVELFYSEQNFHHDCKCRCMFKKFSFLFGEETTEKRVNMLVLVKHD